MAIRSVSMTIAVTALALASVALVLERAADGAEPSVPGTTVGSQSYPVPVGALVVSPVGDDGAAGTAEAPLRTVTRAHAIASPGATIVLRGGTYRESVTITKRVTIQSWPGEAAWFEGSVPVAGWMADGNAWRHDGWTIEFDASPTYTRNAADGAEENWRFVNPDHPMAAHPDQVWIDGEALRQVGSRSQVVAGTFFHDEAADRLFVGNNPTGRQVDASALVRALMVRAEGVVLRGFGVRRFAPSVPDMGAVTLERPGISVEHVAVIDAATTAISAIAADISLTNIEVERSGMLGIHANHADRLLIEGIRSHDNNVEHFNSAPVSGGTKVTRTRGVTVRNSVFAGNDGPGLWMDESVYDITVAGIETRDNSGHGISLELSALAVVVDSVISGNGGFGIKVNDTSDVTIWNNTFVANDRSLNIVQDARRYGDGSPGKDPRYPTDPTMTWVNGPVVAVNNVFADQRRGNCLLCVEDYSHEYTAEQFGVTADSNVYQRPSAGSPRWVAVWSRGAADPSTFEQLEQFRSATGQERSGVEVVGTDVVTSAGDPTAQMPPDEIAQPLPPSLAALVDQPEGVRHLGHFGAARMPDPPPSSPPPTSAPPVTTAPTPTTTSPSPTPPTSPSTTTSSTPVATTSTSVAPGATPITTTPSATTTPTPTTSAAGTLPTVTTIAPSVTVPTTTPTPPTTSPLPHTPPIADDAVQNLTATPGTESVTVAFDPPSDLEPATYTIAVDPTVPGAPFEIDAEAKRMAQSFDELDAGTVYRFTVIPDEGTTDEGSAASVMAAPFAEGVISQAISVERPIGALVLTQRCGVRPALDDFASVSGFPGFPRSLGAEAASADQIGTAPIDHIDAPSTDPEFAEYPNPSNPTYPTTCGVDLGSAQLVTNGPLAGAYYSADGALNEITVSDTRDADIGWSLNGTVESFTSTADVFESFDGNHLGWAPVVEGDSGPNADGYDQVVVPGPAVLPGTGVDTADQGLADGCTLASAAAGSGLGVASMGGRLMLLIPMWVDAGDYRATLTFTAIDASP